VKQRSLGGQQRTSRPETAYRAVPAEALSTGKRRPLHSGSTNTTLPKAGGSATVLRRLIGVACDATKQRARHVNRDRFVISRKQRE